MDVYVYETPDGLIADFRPYLDGQDHAFETPRPLGGGDPRWEKVLGTKDPRSGEPIWGRAKFVGRGVIPHYHELMVFPVAFNGSFTPAPSAAAGH